MKKQFKYLKDLGDLLAKREMAEDDPNYQLALELDKGIGEAVSGLADDLKATIKGMIEEKMGVALEEAAEKATGDAKKAAEEVEKAAEEARHLLDLAKRSPGGMARRAETGLRAAVKAKMPEIREALRERGNKPAELMVNLRAAAEMNTGTFALKTGTDTGIITPGMEFDPVIYGLRYPDNFILEVIGATQVGKVNDKHYTGIATEEGMAAVTAEGGLKPLVSWTIKEDIAKKQKTTAHIELTDELADEDELFNEIKYLLENKIFRDTQADFVGWFEDNAQGYLGSNPLSGTMVLPTNAAAINAAALQMQALGYTPDALYVNPGDMAVDRYLQTSDGQFLYPLDLQASQVSFAKVRESFAVPAGKFLLVDTTMVDAVHSGVGLKFGWINDQLIHNKQTVVGEIFWRIAFRGGEKNAALWGDLETIKTDLTKKAVQEEPAEPAAKAA